MNDEGRNVDPKVEQEILRIENHLTATFSKLINEGFKSVEDSITKLLGKDIEYIKDTQRRFSDHHESHYLNNEKRITDISNVKELIDKKIHNIVDDKFIIINNQVEALNEVRIKYESKQNTIDNIEEKTDRKKEISIGMVGTLCTVSSVVVGVIVYLVS